MADKVTFEITNLAQFDSLMKKLGKSINGSVGKDVVEAGLRVVEGNAVVNIGKTFSGKSKGDLAGNRSVEVIDSGGTVTGKLIFHSNHAMLQEFGGVVKPINAKFLAIPATDMARKIGSPRNYSAKLHFLGSASGGVLMDASGTVIYALKKAVTVPPRPYLSPAIDEHKDEIQAAMGAVINRAFEEANSGND